MLRLQTRRRAARRGARVSVPSLTRTRTPRQRIYSSGVKGKDIIRMREQEGTGSRVFRPGCNSSEGFALKASIV